jgi:hypothetical protein
MANRATWKKRVADWRASGLTAGEFSTRRGFAPTTLTWWSWRLGREDASRAESAPGADAEPLGFAQLVVSEARCDQPRRDTPVVVDLGGVRVEVARGFDAGVLADVLAVLDRRAGGVL